MMACAMISGASCQSVSKPDASAEHLLPFGTHYDFGA
jgi:hypothetical protein